jgi:hypothetical protein
MDGALWRKLTDGNPEVMDRKYIDDHHLVARYLADQLPDSEREAFESYYLDHPEIVRELEAAARFKVGLAQLQNSGELQSLLQPQPWYQQPRFLAIAASMAVVAVASLLWVINQREPSVPLLVASATALVDRSGNPLPVFATHSVMRMRSVSYDAQINLPHDAQTVVLRVLPEVEATPPVYRIRLLSVTDDESLREVAAIGSLKPDGDGLVPVYFDSSKIPGGRYQLELSGDTPTGEPNKPSTFVIQFIDDAS